MSRYSFEVVNHIPSNFLFEIQKSNDKEDNGINNNSNFLSLYSKYPMNELIQNFDKNQTEMKYIIVKEKVNNKFTTIIPFTLNYNSDYNKYNVYTVSTFHHYITYGNVELLQNKINKYIKFGIQFLINIFSNFFKFTKFDKILIVGNICLSTNVYNNDIYLFKEIVNYLSLQYKDHTILIRSINRKIYENIYLKLNNFLFLPSRMIYILDTKDNLKKRDIKDDIKLLNKYLQSTYKILDNFSILEILNNETLQNENHILIKEIQDCYNELYLDKYSFCNVQFTKKFIYESIKQNILQFKCLYHLQNKTIDGCVGYFTKRYNDRNIFVCPILGYKLNKQETPLYRLLSSILLKEAKQCDSIFNQSSGAASFKVLRGCKPYIEYSAIYVEHLPYYRRLPFYVLNVLVEYLVKPIMEHYKL
ncbi:hypothetical protein ABK040_005107 [Willaertia magna]